MRANHSRPLWAPWRIDYIRGEKDGKCFLCGLEREPEPGVADDLVIARGKFVFVILNRYPYNSGHLMIAPYRHTDNLGGLTADEQREIFDFTVRAEKVLSLNLHPDGFNIGWNLGSAAGAGLKDHLHQHIVPRWIGDTNFMPVLGGCRVIPEALEASAKLLRENWS